MLENESRNRRNGLWKRSSWWIRTGGGKGKKKKKKHIEERSEGGNREELPNCGILETGEINGSVPLLEEITKHLK